MKSHRKWPMAGFVLIAALGIAATTAQAQGYSQQQQQLCQDDAFRLCSDFIPDVERVTACMIAKRAQLSPGCKSVFGPPPGAATSAPRGRPVDLAPRKAVKEKARPAKATKAKGKKKPVPDDDDD